jgi:hypothetical protein
MTMRPAAALLLLALALPARAQEAGTPLVLRIHPRGAAVFDEAADPDEAIRRAVAAREAFEARITASAHRAIASVCTGCLAPEPVVTGALGRVGP